jgi:hypothetical protein
MEFCICIENKKYFKYISALLINYKARRFLSWITAFFELAFGYFQLHVVPRATLVASNVIVTPSEPLLFRYIINLITASFFFNQHHFSIAGVNFQENCMFAAESIALFLL